MNYLNYDGGTEVTLERMQFWMKRLPKGLVSITMTIPPGAVKADVHKSNVQNFESVAMVTADWIHFLSVYQPLSIAASHTDFPICASTAVV